MAACTACSLRAQDFIGNCMLDWPLASQTSRNLDSSLENGVVTVDSSYVERLLSAALQGGERGEGAAQDERIRTAEGQHSTTMETGFPASMLDHGEGAAVVESSSDNLDARKRVKRVRPVSAR